MIHHFAPYQAVSIWLLALPCLADEVSNGDEVIGTYTISSNGEAVSLLSYANAEDDFSDLTFDDSFGIKTYHISASADDGIPLLDVTLQEGSVAGDLSIVGVTLIDQDYDTALAAASIEAEGNALDSYGAITDETVDLGPNGSISFAFSADLIRINLETEAPIDGENGLSIDVRFSGTFPMSELSE